MTPRDHHHRLHEAARARALALRAQAFDEAAAALARALRRGAARIAAGLRSPAGPDARPGPLGRSSC